MKTKFLRCSKSAMSLILSVTMLLSSVFVASSETRTSAVQTEDTASVQTDIVNADDSTAADTPQDSAEPEEQTEASEPVVKAEKPVKKTPEKSGGSNVTVYFVNNLDWGTTINLHAWGNGSGTNFAMSPVSGMLYSISIDDAWLTKNNSPSFLFHNGEAWTTSDQTANMNVTSRITGTYSSSTPYFIPDPNSKGNSSYISGSWGNESAYTTWLNNNCGKWYICGKFKTDSVTQSDFNNTCTLFPLTLNATNVYTFDTGKTLKTMGGDRSSYSFGFRKLTTSGWGDFLNNINNANETYNINYENNTGYPLKDSGHEATLYATGKNFSFKSSNTNEAGNVKFWLDTSNGDSHPVFSYSIEEVAAYVDTSDWYLVNFTNSNGTKSDNTAYSNDFKFTKDSDNLYSFSTSMSYAELKRNADYFFIGQRVSGSSAAVFDTEYFVSSSNKEFTGSDSGDGNKVPLSSSGNKYFTFKKMDSGRAARKGTVTFYLDTSVENSPKFYYSFSGVTDTESTSSQSFTVYFDDFDSQWGSVMCYAFAKQYDGTTPISQDSLNKFGNWAGSSMEYQATGDHAGLYKATFNLKVSNKVYGRVLFHNRGSDGSEAEHKGTNQTYDYVLRDGDVYSLKNDLYSVSTCGIPVGNYNNAVYEVYLQGRFTKNNGATQLWLSNDTYKFNNSKNSDFVFTKSSENDYVFNTNSTVTNLSTTYPVNNEAKYQEFYIKVRSKGTNGAITETRYNLPTTRTLTMNDEGYQFAMSEYGDKTKANFYFDDTFNTGTIDLHFNPSESTFWFTSNASHKTISVDSNKTNHFDFTSKNAAVGSTVVLSIKNIPQNRVVNEVTINRKNTAPAASGSKVPNSSGSSEVTVTSLGSNQYSFVMPDYDVEASVSFRAPRTFTVTCQSSDTNKGTVSVNKTKVTEGKSVTVYATPAGVSGSNDNVFSDWSFDDASYGSFTGGTTSTDMVAQITPTHNITITGNFTTKAIGQVSGYYLLYNTKEANVDNWNQNSQGNHIANIYKYTDNSGYFVDLSRESITTDNKTTVFFGVVNVSDYLSFDKDSNLINKATAKTVTSTNTVLVSAEEKENNGNAYRYGKATLKEDSVTSIRIKIDNPSSVTAYTVVPTGSYTAGVKIYAKDGTNRDDSYSTTKYAKIANTTAVKVNDSGSTSALTGLKSHTYYDYGTAEAGDTIRVTTTIESSYCNKYYVKAFCVNGVSYKIIDQPAIGDARRTSGVYSFDYTITDDDEYLEITPIYFYLTDGDYKDLGFITFYVEKYTGDIVNQWGNTLACQAWYTGGSEVVSEGKDPNNLNALGGYPGQPLVYDGGVHYMQVPKRLPVNGNGTITVQGITLNNYYWDYTHQELCSKDVSFKGKYNTRTGRETNSQTYDFNDFAALASMGVDTIIFSMKYETATAHKDTSSSALLDTSVYGNGWHGFVDYYDRGIDLFGHILYKDGASDKRYGSQTDVYSEGTTPYNEGEVEARDNTKKLWIVSRGYQAIENSQDGYYGNYATIWDIYSYDGSTFTKRGSLPGSSLIPNNTSNSYTYLSNGKLPTKDDTENASTYAANKAIFLAFCTEKGTAADAYFDEYVNLYNDYVGYPAVITYEKAITEAGVQDDPGMRSDGRWYYSATSSSSTYPINANPAITCTLKIQYIGASGVDYTDDVLDSANNYRGTTTNATVGFTNIDNDDEEYVKKSSSSIVASVPASTDPAETFDFKADAVKTVEYDDNGTTKYRVYVFEGWYLDFNGDIENINKTDPTATDASVPRLVSNTYIARYKEVEGDYAIIGHEMLKANSTDTVAKSKGSGKTYTTIEVLNSNNTHAYTYPKSESPIMIEPVYLVEGSGYKFKITLEAEPDDYSITGKTYSESTGTTEQSDLTFTLTGSEVLGLISGITNKSKTYYTDFSLRKLRVTYKYFDRNVVDGSVDDVKSVATSVDVDVPYKVTDTCEQIITNGLNQDITYTNNNSLVSVSNLKNILDQYYIWTTQTVASGANGIKSLPDYKANPNGSVDYSKRADFDSTKHFTSLGEPAFDSTTPNWVNYKVGDNTAYNTGLPSSDPEDAEYVAESAYKPGDQSITEIVVWAYNTPKMYNLKLFYPKAEGSDGYDADREQEYYSVLKTSADDAGSKMPSGIYYIPEGSVNQTKDKTEINTFYNQRIGVNQGTVTTNESGVVTDVTDDRDKPGTHIGKYGIKAGYVNTKAIALTEIKKPVTVEEETTYVTEYIFDGWYDLKTGTKMATDNDYGYRVTTGMKLVAGYVKATNEKSSYSTINAPRPSVTANDMDYYFVTNTSDQTTTKERVRFNTQLNVFNSPDSNPNITNIAAIYVQLRVNGSGTEYTTKHAYELLQESEFVTTLKSTVYDIIKNETDTGTYKGNIVYKNETVGYDVTYLRDNSSLNNKNRAQFTLDIDKSKYEKNGSMSAMLVFGGIKVSGQWYVSDNFVSYVNYEPSKTPAAASTSNAPEVSVEKTSVVNYASGSGVTVADDTIIFSLPDSDVVETLEDE